MDLYRITRIDPRRPGKPKVQYGTSARVVAIRRTVRQNNEGRVANKAWVESKGDRYNASQLPPDWWEPIELRVERAVVTDWVDVSAEVNSH